MCKNCTAAFHVVSLLTLDTSHAVHLILSSSLICDLKCSDTEYKPLDCDIQVKIIEWDSFATKCFHTPYFMQSHGFYALNVQTSFVPFG